MIHLQKFWNHGRLGCVVVLLGCLTLISVAQDDLEQHYIALDESYEIRYPGHWQITEDDPAFIVVGGATGSGNLAMTVFSTETIAIYGFLAESALEFAQAVAAGVEIVQDDAVSFDVSGRDAARASVRVEGQAGAAIIIEMASGDYGMVIVLADETLLEQQSKLILEIISTYNTPGTALTVTTPEAPQITQDFLEAYDGYWKDAIDELQALELIGDEGRLVFQEDYAFFDGVGRWLTPLAQERPSTDVVVAGELTFRSGNDEAIESCSLLARIASTDSTTVGVYLEVGIDNNNDLYYLDRADEAGEAVIFEFVPLNLNLDDSHHILYIASGDSLTVYLNGQRYFTEALIHERSGYYGINLLGQSANSSCEGQNIWVYEVGALRTPICEISTNAPANKRGGPGTTFDRVGQLQTGDVLLAIGQITATDGFRWWQLNDASWVREDVVIATGNCEALPQSEDD